MAPKTQKKLFSIPSWSHHKYSLAIAIVLVLAQTPTIGGQSYRCPPSGVLDWQRAAESISPGGASSLTRLAVTECTIPSFDALSSLSQLEELTISNSQFVNASIPRLKLKSLKLENNPRLERVQFLNWGRNQMFVSLSFENNERLILEDFMFNSFGTIGTLEIKNPTSSPNLPPYLFAKLGSDRKTPDLDPGAKLRIHKLVLDEVRLTQVPVNALKHVILLRTLILNNNEITEISTPRAIDQENLAELALSNNYIENIEPGALVAPKLETLDLSVNNIAYMNPAAFSSCKGSLKSVNLEENFMLTLYPELFEWERLQSLQLMMSKYTDSQWRCECGLYRLLKRVPMDGILRQIR